MVSQFQIRPILSLIQFCKQNALEDFNEARTVADEKVRAEIDREIDVTKSSQVRQAFMGKKESLVLVVETRN